MNLSRPPGAGRGDAFSLVKLLKILRVELWGIYKSEFQFFWINSTYFEGYCIGFCNLLQ